MKDSIKHPWKQVQTPFKADENTFKNRLKHNLKQAKTPLETGLDNI